MQVALSPFTCHEILFLTQVPSTVVKFSELIPNIKLMTNIQYCSDSFSPVIKMHSYLKGIISGKTSESGSLKTSSIFYETLSLHRSISYYALNSQLTVYYKMLTQVSYQCDTRNSLELTFYVYLQTLNLYKIISQLQWNPILIISCFLTYVSVPLCLIHLLPSKSPVSYRLILV